MSDEKDASEENPFLTREDFLVRVCRRRWDIRPSISRARDVALTMEEGTTNQKEVSPLFLLLPITSSSLTRGDLQQ